jgi:hypothetical protein
VASPAAPGGFLRLAECHPVTEMLADDGRTVRYDYVNREPTRWDEPGNCTDSGVEPEQHVH